MDQICLLYDCTINISDPDQDPSILLYDHTSFEIITNATNILLIVSNILLVYYI